MAIKMIISEMEIRGYKDKYDKFAVALDEILTNALIHGSWDNKNKRMLSKKDFNKKINIKVTIIPDEIKVVIKDRGKGFNVSNLPDPTHPENIFNHHGRGVFITRNFVDSLEYNKKGNQATLIMSLKNYGKTNG